MLDDVLLQRFASEFFGYGRPDAAFWFVGMEEAGAGQESEARQRLEAWNAMGSNALVDCADFHARVEDEQGPLDRLFQPDAKIQPTWGPLIRFFLRARGSEVTTTERVRQAQASDWGRSTSDNCLVELLPLPSPNADDWLYSEWSALACFADRDAYREHFRSPRIARLREMILKHRPRVVLFYGSGYLRWWSQIAEIPLSAFEKTSICENAKGRKLFARISAHDGTVYVCSYHPSYVNQSTYFEGIGDIVRNATPTG